MKVQKIIIVIKERYIFALVFWSLVPSNVLPKLLPKSRQSVYISLIF